MTFGNSTYRCGNYSREETIHGQKLFTEIRYVLVHKDGSAPPSGMIETQCNDMTKEKNLAKKLSQTSKRLF